MKILLVEDDKKLTMAMGIRLKASGFECTTSTDAIGAVSAAVAQKPDLIIIDVNLPGGDGFLVAERLMGLGATASIPFIFMTASKKSGLREKAMQLGAKGFLEKPFHSTQLFDLIGSSGKQIGASESMAG